MKRLWGIRVEPETETAGLDVSEHGMWGYPEFYIPVPGGYGTETHGHLGLSHGHGARGACSCRACRCTRAGARLENGSTRAPRSQRRPRASR